MLPAPERQEIDHRTLKLVVGVIALSLPVLTSLFAPHAIASISASYYEGGWSQSIFVGFLFAIAAFLLAYNGFSKAEMVLSKIASAAALGVALFPCQCGDHVPDIPFVHGVSAAVMFLILAYFCYGFYKRARAKGHPEAIARATIYTICGVAIVVAIVAMAIDNILTDHVFTRLIARFTFYGETTGLVAFGVSWLTASRTLPGVTRPDERFSPLRQQNPP